jgi:hypothetical protein
LRHHAWTVIDAGYQGALRGGFLAVIGGLGRRVFARCVENLWWLSDWKLCRLVFVRFSLFILLF